MSESSGRTSIPRSVRQKRILDEAAADPAASLEEIAGRIPSASPDLVDRVLEEYGDPGSSDQSEVTTEPDEPPRAVLPAVVELTDHQREVLELIADHPLATQAELAERLDVSAPTVCNRVNAIPGFDWETRREFVAAWQSARDAPDQQDQPLMTLRDGQPDDEAQTAALEARVAALESRVDGTPPTEGEPVPLAPELTQKVLHACIHSDQITADEELEIIAALLP